MASFLSGIQRTLFFTDVPKGTLKHKPQTKNGATSIGQTLFFSDLQSVGKQTVVSEDNQSVATRQTETSDDDKSEASAAKVQEPMEDKASATDELPLENKSKAPIENKQQPVNDKTAVSITKKESADSKSVVSTTKSKPSHAKWKGKKSRRARKSKPEGIEEILLFPDVPDGTLKYKPETRPGATSIGQAFSNLGKDIENALFFTDLQSIGKSTVATLDNQSVASGTSKQKSTAASASSKTSFQQKFKNKFGKRSTKREQFLEEAFQPLGDISVIDEDETSIQADCRGLTIPPPALARMKREEAAREFARQQMEEQERQARLIAEYAEKLTSKRS